MSDDGNVLYGQLQWKGRTGLTHQTFKLRRSLVGNNIVDHPGVVK